MVGPAKQQRLRRAAAAWLAANPDLAELETSFEVLAVRPDGVERVVEAF
jgi:Holliday junction resolvase-like predicted endonuclease